MDRCFKFTATLFLCSAFVLPVIAKDLYADYTAEEAPAVAVQPAVEEDPAQQQWQIYFADACALAMSDEHDEHAQAGKILIGLLDARPDSDEALKLLQTLLVVGSLQPENELRSSVVRLANKHPSARRLNLFAIACINKNLPREEQIALLKNTLEILIREPLTDEDDVGIRHNALTAFLLACAYALEANDPAVARTLTRCRIANPFYKKDLKELRHALDLMQYLLRDPALPTSQAKTDALAFYSDLLISFQKLIQDNGLEKLPPDEKEKMDDYIVLCLQLVDAGQADQLVASLEKSLAENPDQTANTELLVCLYYKQKKADKALDLAQKHLKKSKKPSIQVAAFCIDIRKERKQYDDLLIFLEQTLPASALPEKVQTALRLEQLRFFMEKKDYFRAAAVLKPMKTFQSLSGRVQLLAHAQRPEEAYQLLKEKAVPRFLAGERSTNEQQDQVFLEMAMFLCDMYQDHDTMIEIYSIWLKEHPDDHLTLNNLAYQYAVKNIKLDEAQKMISAALKARPDVAAYMDTMAWVLYRQKKYQDAAAWIEKTLVAFGGDKCESDEALDHAGDIYFALGDRKKAALYWQRALNVLEKRRPNLKSDVWENMIKAIREKLDAIKEKKDK